MLPVRSMAISPGAFVMPFVRRMENVDPVVVAVPVRGVPPPTGVMVAVVPLTVRVSILNDGAPQTSSPGGSEMLYVPSRPVTEPPVVVVPLPPVGCLTAISGGLQVMLLIFNMSDCSTTTKPVVYRLAKSSVTVPDALFGS